MAFAFPGWPGPAYNGGRSNIGGVGLPAFPAMPGHPGLPTVAGMAGAPGFPGTAPGLPGTAPSPAAGANAGPPASPLAGLAQYGVPVGHTASGQPVVHAGINGRMMLPPQIPGMPQMPGPPMGFMAGGPQAGGLFQPMLPVAPFDGGNQVRHLEQRRP